jgi:hypothetical protein
MRSTHMVHKVIRQGIIELYPGTAAVNYIPSPLNSGRLAAEDTNHN